MQARPSVPGPLKEAEVAASTRDLRLRCRFHGLLLVRLPAGDVLAKYDPVGLAFVERGLDILHIPHPIGAAAR